VGGRGAWVMLHSLDPLSTLKARVNRDGTIISGDSLGVVKFWDSRTCTQLQSFQAHGADVLCLAIGPVSLRCCEIMSLFSKTFHVIDRKAKQSIVQGWIKRLHNFPSLSQIAQMDDGFNLAHVVCILMTYDPLLRGPHTFLCPHLAIHIRFRKSPPSWLQAV
jgi:hypothetical protein